MITILDIDRARSIFDIDLPSDEAPDSAVENYRGSLSSRVGLLPVGPLGAFGRTATPNEMRLEVGFDQRAWDQVIEAGRGHASRLVFKRRYDADLIEAAVQNDPNWRDLLEVVEYEGNTIYQWGTDGRIVWVRHTDAIQDVVSAITGRRRTLADVPELLQLGVLADELDLYSALLTM